LHPNLFFRNFQHFDLSLDVAHYTGLVNNPVMIEEKRMFMNFEKDMGMKKAIIES